MLGELIRKDSVHLFVCLVIVDKELHVAIAVDVHQRNVVGGMDQLIINDL